MVKDRPDVAFYIKMFPLKSHPGAYEKAKAVVCGKSLALLEDAFAGKELPKAKCATSAPLENSRLAEKLGIASTPTLVLPDGRVVHGYRDARALKELIGK